MLSKSGTTVPVFHLCGQPAQQQGLLLPAFKSESIQSMRLSRVSCFLAEIIQQINSFLANAVISFQATSALLSLAKACLTSFGNVCANLQFHHMLYLSSQQGRSALNSKKQLARIDVTCFISSSYRKVMVAIDERPAS